MPIAIAQYCHTGSRSRSPYRLNGRWCSGRGGRSCRGGRLAVSEWLSACAGVRR